MKGQTLWKMSAIYRSGMGLKRSLPASSHVLLTYCCVTKHPELSEFTTFLSLMDLHVVQALPESAYL